VLIKIMNQEDIHSDTLCAESPLPYRISTMEPPSTTGLTAQKLCKRCGSVKSIDGFYCDKKSKDRKSWCCKSCVREKATKWAKKNPERYAKRVAAWHAANPGKVKAHRQKSYAKGEWRERWYMKSYGLTVAQVDEMIQGQEGRCYICGTDKPEGRSNTRLMVDHDHNTGRVRRMLCAKCNTGLGSFREDPSLLRKAAGYLEFYKQP
jgi:hypothetical protein